MREGSRKEGREGASGRRSCYGAVEPLPISSLAPPPQYARVRKAAPASHPQCRRRCCVLECIIYEDLSSLGNKLLGHKNNIVPDVHKDCVALKS
jgi:hypothetical protein